MATIIILNIILNAHSSLHCQLYIGSYWWAAQWAINEQQSAISNQQTTINKQQPATNEQHKRTTASKQHKRTANLMILCCCVTNAWMARRPFETLNGKVPATNDRCHCLWLSAPLLRERSDHWLGTGREYARLTQSASPTQSKNLAVRQSENLSQSENWRISQWFDHSTVRELANVRSPRDWSITSLGVVPARVCGRMCA